MYKRQARAFEKAGAETEILVVKNLSVHDIEETIDRMEKAIRSAQIVMLPGGFSGGDEPEGSGKFIATTFRNPKIAQAVTDLLETRDGLMLGICNGFQALIKLGPVSYTHLEEIDSCMAAVQAQLQYFQLQIRPHFYLNCMKNLNSLIDLKAVSYTHLDVYKRQDLA